MKGFGTLLKYWRNNRHLSQEALAFEAEISTRHLSFLENSKSLPSRQMVLLLASALELELRERNTLLASAGFAPMYATSPLESHEMAPIQKAIDMVLEKQEPYGAIVVDRVWNVLKTNQGALNVLNAFLPQAPEDPSVMTNLVKGVLHRQGLRQSMVNWPDVAAFTLERVERECATFPHDEARLALLDEVRAYPGVAAIKPLEVGLTQSPVLLVHLRRGDAEVRLFTMLTTIGTPLDVTAQDVRIETYFPADAATEAWVHRWTTSATSPAAI